MKFNITEPGTRNAGYRKQVSSALYRISLVLIFLLAFSLAFSLFTSADARIYIDITAPGFRKLPISISFRGHEAAKETAEIVQKDLDFTGIFYLVDPGILGAEISVKIDVEISEGIKADVLVFDLIGNRQVLSKRYTATKKLLRALAHTISNDIYYEITGRQGVFRTKISYVVSTYRKKWLYIMDWDGANPVRKVTKGLTLNHSWTPDGLNLVYASARKKKWGIYMRNLRTFRETVLFKAAGLNLAGGISRDNRIAFSSSKDGNPEIYVMNINRTGLKKITRSFGIDVSPAFSPDGKWIAFVSDRGGSPQIYIMDPDGKRLRRLTFKGSYNTSPAWSPDGKWVAFVGRKHGKNQIFMIKSDSADLIQLTDRGNNENPSFSPDGMFIAFDSDRAGLKGIYLMNINGEELKRISPRQIKAMNPQWSPYIK